MSNDGVFTPDEKDSQVKRGSIVENIRNILDEYHIIFSLSIGYLIGNIIDRFFDLDVFYNNPILRHAVMPMMIMSLLIALYIGYTNKTKLIRFLEFLFFGNVIYFVSNAFSLILFFIDDYITNYSMYHTAFNIHYWWIFSIVRSLGLSGFFALLEKLLSIGQKIYTEDYLQEAQEADIPSVARGKL